MELIRLQLVSKYPNLEIRSVDGFQGREKEAVVLSLVRSNQSGEIGFLSESRRLNVAVTRARRHVAVICNVETVSTDKFLREFVNYLEKHGDIRSAMQYQSGIDAQDLARPDGLELTIKDEASKSQKGGGGESKKSGTKQKLKKKRIEGDKKQEQHHSEDNFKKKKERFQKHKMTEEELEERSETKTKAFENIINEFMRSKDQFNFKFSSDLNSHDRLLVHEIAERYGLHHESIGEGNERRIVLRKSGVGGEKSKGSGSISKEKSIERAINEMTVDDVEQINEQEEEYSSENTDEFICTTCKAKVPKTNFELHKIRCAKIVDDKIASAKLSRENEIAKKKKAKKVKNAAVKIKKIDENEDLDKLLATFDKLDNVCNYVKCREKISVLGVTCGFCRVRFCLTHGMPEIHGCGDSAKRAARQQISRDGKLFAGSGRPSFKPDPDRKAQLQKRLDKKLGGMEDERKTKKKDKK